jgi:hypothetical protein
MAVQALLAQWLRLGQSSAAEIEGLMSGIGRKVHYHAWNVTISLIVLGPINSVTVRQSTSNSIEPCYLCVRLISRVGKYSRIYYFSPTSIYNILPE